MEKNIIGIFGAGGYAREVMPFLKENYQEILGENVKKDDIDFFYVVNNFFDGEINGIKVLSESEFFLLNCSRKYFNVAIADSRLREKIVKKAIENDLIPLEIKASSVKMMDECNVAEGAIFSHNVIITSNIKIGRYFHANIYSYVAHDCVIGDYVTFAPSVHCNGNVIIGDHAYIGTGAIIKQGTPENPIVIGEGAIVGMGAVVTKSVEPYTIVVGNPAKRLVK